MEAAGLPRGAPGDGRPVANVAGGGCGHPRYYHPGRTVQKHKGGPTIAAGEALLAAYDDLDFLLRSTGASVHVYGCDPYSFATRLSRIAEDLDECEGVTLTI